LRAPSSLKLDAGLLFVVLIWGLSPSIFKFVFQEISPLTFVFVRFLLLSAVSVVVLFVHQARGGTAWRIRRQDLGWLIVSGLSGFGIYQLFLHYGAGSHHGLLFFHVFCHHTAVVPVVCGDFSHRAYPPSAVGWALQQVWWVCSGFWPKHMLTKSGADWTGTSRQAR